MERKIKPGDLDRKVYVSIPTVTYDADTKYEDVVWGDDIELYASVIHMNASKESVINGEIRSAKHRTNLSLTVCTMICGWVQHRKDHSRKIVFTITGIGIGIMVMAIWGIRACMRWILLVWVLESSCQPK